MFGALIGDLLSSCFNPDGNDGLDLKVDLGRCRFSDVSRVLLRYAVRDELIEAVPVPSAYAIATVMAYKAQSLEELRGDLEGMALELGVGEMDARAFIGCGMMLHQAIIGKVKSKITCGADVEPTLGKAFSAFMATSTVADAIRVAIRSCDGSDRCTAAFLAGALSEAYYGIEHGMMDSVFPFLNAEEWQAVNDLVEGSPLPSRGKYHIALKYERSLLEDMPDFCQDFMAHLALKDYGDILDMHGLGWNERAMLNADFMNLGEPAIVSLITGAIRAESFSAGAIKTFLPVLPLWLNRLNDFNDTIHDDCCIPHSKAVKSIRIEMKGSGFIETMDCSMKSISICTGTDLGSMRHEYSFEGMEMRKLLNMLMHRFSTLVRDSGWLDSETVDSARASSSCYELKAECNDGSVVVHHGLLDRVHVPGKAFCSAIGLLTDILGRLGFGRITDLSLFNSAWKEGEVKYCGCIFHEGGKIYHYRTLDPSIKVGDEVVVPVGDEGERDVVTVKTVEFCRWDDTPYPLERTKEIIGLASDNENLLEDDDILLLESDE